LSKFAALKDLDVEFYSLQKGQPAESELAGLVRRNWDGPHIIDLTSLLTQFFRYGGTHGESGFNNFSRHLNGALGWSFE
jgi:hypothetical protein